MKWLKFLFFISFLIASAIGIKQFYPSKTESETSIFEVEAPSLRTISQSISAAGILEVKDQMKIGCLVSGVIKALHVEENQVVTEGQLLAEIETGKGDTELKEAEAHYEKSVIELDFQKKGYERQQELFNKQFIPAAKFEEAEKSYLLAVHQERSQKANLNKKRQEYLACQVRAPTAGVVTAVGVTKGERVSESSTTALFHIAPDIHTMEADFVIDERDIGQIKKGQKVQLIVDTYPGKIFETSIYNINFSPKEKDNVRTFHAKAYLDNTTQLLRPGMNVSATIDVAIVSSALSITSLPFLIKEEHLQSAAKCLHYKVQGLESKARKDYIVAHPNQNIQFVWKVLDQAFVEIPVEIGVSDSIHFEILGGLQDKDSVVIEVLEEDQMQKIYDHISRARL